jgi:predicted Zn-dependent peptidase
MADVRFGLDLLGSGGFRHQPAHAPAACVRLEHGILTMIRHLFALLALTSGTVLGADADRWTLPIETRTLDNGLTVVVSEDHNSPTFGISVVYKVGMRLEPRDRTGFAHLFEHMMFEGTPNAPSGTFDKVVQGGGGILNGSTRADYTNYIASAPVSALEPILWLEADRMKTLDFSPVNLKNQQDVVKEEIRVNVKNQPYGIFFVLDMLGLAFDKWENSHDGYGSFVDLENAKLEDVAAFHRDYYGPDNAVIGIAGAVKAADVFALVEKYFGAIERRKTPQRPDVGEGLNTAPRRLDQGDPLARVPGVAVAWKMPARASGDHAPMAVLASLMVGDDATRLYQGLVKGRELLLQVQGGLNWPLGNAWDYDGPTLLTLFALYKPNASADSIVAAIEQEIARIAEEGVSDAELARVKTRMLSSWYGSLEAYISRADTIAKKAALWGDANAVNRIPSLVEGVTAAEVRRVAKTYLVATNRSVIDRRPQTQPAAATLAQP